MPTTRGRPAWSTRRRPSTSPATRRCTCAACSRTPPCSPPCGRVLERGGLVVAIGPSAAALSDPMFDVRGGGFTLGLGLATGVAIIPESETWSDRGARPHALAGDDAADRAADGVGGDSSAAIAGNCSATPSPPATSRSRRVRRSDSHRCLGIKAPPTSSSDRRARKSVVSVASVVAGSARVASAGAVESTIAAAGVVDAGVVVIIVVVAAGDDARAARRSVARRRSRHR